MWFLTASFWPRIFYTICNEFALRLALHYSWAIKRGRHRDRGPELNFFSDVFINQVAGGREPEKAAASVVSSRKGGRPGLPRLPSGTFSAEPAHREAYEQEPSCPRPAQSPGRGRRFSMRNCWECFSASRVLSCWLTPASHSRLRCAFPFLPRPCLHPSLELPEPATPPRGPRGARSVPSRHVSGPALPSCSAPSQLESSRPATLVEPCPGPSPQN